MGQNLKTHWDDIIFTGGKVIEDDDEITQTEQLVQNELQKYNENPEMFDEQSDQFELIKITYNFKKTQIRRNAYNT